MRKNIDIIRFAIEGLQQDLLDNGSIDIGLILMAELELEDDIVETLACSYIRSEANEGIYYDPARDRLFFYGEPRAHSFGGKQWVILIDSELMLLIPPTLVELLKKVAETRIPITITLEDSYTLGR